MLNYTLWRGYPLPALLFMARRGDARSNLNVLNYFAAAGKRGGGIDPDVMEYVAGKIDAVLTAEDLKTREALQAAIFKGRGRDPIDRMEIYDKVMIARGRPGSTLDSAIDDVSRAEKVPWDTVRSQYMRELKYQRLLAKIQTLLDAIATAGGSIRERPEGVYIVFLPVGANRDCAKELKKLKPSPEKDDDEHPT